MTGGRLPAVSAVAFRPRAPQGTAGGAASRQAAAASGGSGPLERLLDLLQEAWQAVARHRLRSLLAASGVVIGVAAVVTLMGLGKAAGREVQGHFAGIGRDLIVVMGGAAKGGGMSGGAASLPTLTWGDLAAIRQEVPEVALAVPSARAAAQAVSAEGNWSTTIQGTEPDLLRVANWHLAAGEAFTPADLAGRARVALLGSTVAAHLFPPGTAALGAAIRIRGTPFTVVGLLAPKGQGGPGQDQDDAVLIPLTTHLEVLGAIAGTAGIWLPGDLSLQARGDSRAAQEAVTALLRERHRLAADQEDDFQLMNVAQVAAAAQSVVDILGWLMTATAGISLAVGALGVMNTLLASLSERTRELGLRLAIGAAPGDLVALVLCESVLLTATGGAAGAVLGWALTGTISAVTGYDCAPGGAVIAVAVAVAAGTGLVAGIAPAVRASRMDPITALREA